MSVSNVIDRLEGVKETGAGRWIARCPSHEDHSPSLSVRDVEGRTLLNCFGGCLAIDICHAIGLELSDLLHERACAECRETYSPRHPDHLLCPSCFTHSPTRHTRRPGPRIPAVDALAALDHEMTVVAIVAHDILEHRDVDEETWARLSVAVQRIGAARALCCPESFR